MGSYVKHNWVVGETITEALMDHLEEQYDDADAELTTHEVLDTGVHGAGGDILATDADIDTHAALTATHGVAGTIADTAELITHAVLSTGVHGTTIILKSSDETENNNDTLQNDDELFFAVGANEVWEFYVLLDVTSGTIPDFKLDWTVPTAGALKIAYHDMIGATAANVSIVAIENGTPRMFDGSTTSNRLILGWARYVGAGNAGNVQLQWAQNTATVSDTTVHENSFIIAHKLG